VGELLLDRSPSRTFGAWLLQHAPDLFPLDAAEPPLPPSAALLQPAAAAGVGGGDGRSGGGGGGGDGGDGDGGGGNTGGGHSSGAFPRANVGAGSPFAGFSGCDPRGGDGVFHAWTLAALRRRVASAAKDLAARGFSAASPPPFLSPDCFARRPPDGFCAQEPCANRTTR